MKWYRAIFDGAKTHFFPEVLKAALLTNMENRGCKIDTTFTAYGGPLVEVEEIGVTLGMSCLMDMSYTSHKLDDIVFTTETRELEYFLGELKETNERLELGIPYYKIHGRFHCVCFLPEQRAQLIRLMKEKLPEAMAIADAENDAFNRGLEKLANNRAVLTPRPVRKMVEV